MAKEPKLILPMEVPELTIQGANSNPGPSFTYWQDPPSPPKPVIKIVSVSDPSQYLISSLRHAVPGAMGNHEKCPVCDVLYQCHIWGLVQHLNDNHRWEYSRIADWLDTLDADLTFQPASIGD